MELVYQLFDSWEPDAVVMDRERGIYADWRKVHPIHFAGEFFKCRGPLNTRTLASAASDFCPGPRVAARTRLCCQARRFDYRACLSAGRHEGIPR
jgi:hypothetical protein